MSDWIALGFFAVLIVGAIAGLKMLSKPRRRTAEEFERSVAEGSTGLGATLGALQDAIDPAAARSKIVVTEMKQGRYQKKRREGKAEGEAHSEEEG